MPLQKFSVILMVGLMLSALCLSAGCITQNELPRVAKADLELKISVQSDASGGYIYVPYLLGKNPIVVTGVSKDLVLKDNECNFSTAHTLKGEMFNISLDKANCASEGKETIREPQLRDSEEYLDYTWASPNQTRPTSLPVFVSYPVSNLSIIHTILVSVTFSGKSNYCFRNALFVSTLFQNGTWQEVPGTDSAACT